MGPRKKLTMSNRREALFAALEAMRVQYDRAGYLQGCRAANPAKHDTEEVRERENRAGSLGAQAQGKAITIFNSAVRAARADGRNDAE